MSTKPPKDMQTLADNPSPVEIVKDNSDYLRGDITAGLEDEITGAISEADTNLIKFHGIYQQDNRDKRNERAQRKLEPDYSFMIRLRVPGGALTPAQWLAVESAARTLTEAGSIRLTTRQTLQFHGVAKTNLRPLLQQCAEQLLDSIAACGDVNRNVMASGHAGVSAAHAAAHDVAAEISQRLLPKSRAYYEIWLGEEKLADGAPTDEPLYGKHYLPRKFKIGVAVPPVNDIDVYSQDIGFAAVLRAGELQGFNVIAGGGLGVTRGDARTYPRLGTPIGFCRPQEAADVAWHIAAWQRDYGDRSDRKVARLKYTIDRLGLEFFRRDVEARLGAALAPPRTLRWTHRGDALGWRQQEGGLWDLGVFVENGRIAADSPLMAAMREFAQQELGTFQMSPNQNLLLINIAEREQVSALLAKHGIDEVPPVGMRAHAMACVALPTCPLAMAEAERYLPVLVSRLQTELTQRGLQKQEISIRMSGCPNGCSRPYLGEIGLVGKSPGRYDLYLGGGAKGERLATLAAENLDEEMIVAALVPLFDAYAGSRQRRESFGDFVARTQPSSA